jgi:Skp family chaperone for outer membrane proteins
MHKLKTVAVLLTAISVGAVAPLRSSHAAEAEIAYVDVQAVIAKSKMGQQMSQRFNSMLKEREQSVEKERNAIKEMEEGLKKDQDVIGKQEREKREQELRARVQGFQRLVAETRQELNKENAEFTQEALGPVLEVVAEIAKKEGMTAVFEKGRSGLLYADSEADLTAKVIERLDAKN